MKNSTVYEYLEIWKKLSPITLDMLVADTSKKFNKVFDDWFLQGIRKLEANADLYKSLTEDGLSSVLAGNLSTPEISVTREEHSKGHADLTIKTINSRPQRVILGEAKIWHGKKSHIKGLDQLLSRYLTGREDRCFVISYVKKEEGIESLFKQLKEYMNQLKPNKMKGNCIDNNHMGKWAFVSNHSHKSKVVLEVLNIGCNLHVPDN